MSHDDLPERDWRPAPMAAAGTLIPGDLIVVDGDVVRVTRVDPVLRSRRWPAGGHVPCRGISYRGARKSGMLRRDILDLVDVPPAAGGPS